MSFNLRGKHELLHVASGINHKELKRANKTVSISEFMLCAGELNVSQCASSSTLTLVLVMQEFIA